MYIFFLLKMVDIDSRHRYVEFVNLPEILNPFISMKAVSLHVSVGIPLPVLT